MIGMIAAVAVLAVGTYLFRIAGPLLRSRLHISARVQQLLDRVALALLIAVALTTAVYADGDPAGWARPLGVSAGVAAALFKAPLVVVIVVAAGTTAVLRAVGLQ